MRTTSNFLLFSADFTAAQRKIQDGKITKEAAAFFVDCDGYAIKQKQHPLTVGARYYTLSGTVSNAGTLEILPGPVVVFR